MSAAASSAMHLHRYTPRKAFLMAIRPLRRLFWRIKNQPLLEWDAVLGDPGRRVLVVIAHPDDEVFCSGLLCALADRGDSLTLACFTRGEGGAQGAEEVGELAAKRSAELEASAKVLGVEEVRYLDYIDPMPRRGTAHEPQFEAPTLFADINELIESVAPDLIITHGSSGEYWHAAHILLHDFVCKAASRSGAIPVATFNAFNAAHPLQEIVNEDDRSTFLFGIPDPFISVVNSRCRYRNMKRRVLVHVFVFAQLEYI